jgi:hypothetical protein
MISLPMPFILAKGMRWAMRCYMAEKAADYQCRHGCRGAASKGDEGTVS